MQAIEKAPTRKISDGQNNFEKTGQINCFQAREKLDALFGGESMMEETPAAGRRILFEHLQICRNCCRSFDVRVRFPIKGRGIY